MPLGMGRTLCRGDDTCVALKLLLKAAGGCFQKLQTPLSCEVLTRLLSQS